MARYLSRNNDPLTNWNNHPVYLTTILTGLFIIGLILTAVAGPLAGLLIFRMPLVPEWSLWRLVTYVFVGEMSFFTPFAIFCFYCWSMGIETHVGRTVLAKLLALLLLTSPLVTVICWKLGVPTVAAGNYSFTCGILIAFATLYPNTEAWGWVPFKWLAFACVACGSLMLLSNRSWGELSQLWASCAVGFAYMRHAKELDYDDAESPFARLGKLFERKPKFRVVPRPANARRVVEDADEIESIDPLLDKIARTGMASLTAKERARLEKAREALMKKDRE